MKSTQRLICRHYPTRTVPFLVWLSSAALVPSAFADTTAAAEKTDETQFDVQAMQARGVDPKLANWFSQAPRFMPGETQIKLTVNGSDRGKMTAQFNKEGQLCADKAFISKAGLAMPANLHDSDSCFDIKTAWPQTELTLDPGEGRVDLVVPQMAVVAPGEASGNWTHGGTAAMLNYDAQYMDSAGSTAGTRYMQLDTEAGFNVKDWIVRSRQNVSSLNGENSVQHQATYAQRTFADQKKVLQTGQISLSNSMFGAGQVWGAQVFPEAALLNSQRGAGLVQGIADSRSVVEVRQAGALIYSTTVPAGPFTLQGFSLLNTRTDLEVTQTGANGDKRQFTVPAAAFLRNGPMITPGLSYGVGKLDQMGSDNSPIIGTVATGWLLSPKNTLNAGILGATLYRAAAISLDSQLFDATQMSLQTTAAQDSHHGESGLSLTSAVNHQLTERVSVNASMMQKTSGFRELSDAVQNDQSDVKNSSRNQYGAGIGWSQETLGSLSVSWARSTNFIGEGSTYVSGSWSRQISRAYVGVSLQHSTATPTTAADDRLYVNVSIPFGNRSVSSYLNSSKSGDRTGVRYSDRSSQDRGWSLASDHDLRNNDTTSTATADMVTPVSQLSGSLSQDSGTNSGTSWSGRATGSVVAHNHGVTFTPYRVGDTFGIAKVGDQAGVRLETPSGPTWTDGRGYAVLPSLSGYRKSSVEVDTRSLAKNIDIGNAWQDTEVARGSVSYINFDVVTTRRVLVTITDAQGKPLPHGSSVFDAAGNFVTVVGENGSVFIPDAKPGMAFDVQSSGVTLCRFPLALPEKAATSDLYETAGAKCR